MKGTIGDNHVQGFIIEEVRIDVANHKDVMRNQQQAGMHGDVEIVGVCHGMNDLCVFTIQETGIVLELIKVKFVLLLKLCAMEL